MVGQPDSEAWARPYLGGLLVGLGLRLVSDMSDRPGQREVKKTVFCSALRKSHLPWSLQAFPGLFQALGQPACGGLGLAWVGLLFRLGLRIVKQAWPLSQDSIAFPGQS